MRGNEEEDPWFIHLIDEAARDWAANLAESGV